MTCAPTPARKLYVCIDNRTPPVGLLICPTIGTLYEISWIVQVFFELHDMVTENQRTKALTTLKGTYCTLLGNEAFCFCFRRDSALSHAPSSHTPHRLAVLDSAHTRRLTLPEVNVLRACMRMNAMSVCTAHSYLPLLVLHPCLWHLFVSILCGPSRTLLSYRGTFSVRILRVQDLYGHHQHCMLCDAPHALQFQHCMLCYAPHALQFQQLFEELCLRVHFKSVRTPHRVK